jgi:tRNA(adenine34) deaminase
MNSDLDEFYMRQVVGLADSAANLGEVPVGALVVLDGVIIGKGWNQPIAGHDPTAHAEIVAIRDAASTIKNYRLAGATLYVSLEPCTMCAGAIVHSRISRVVYGATEPKSGVAESNGCLFSGQHLNHQVELTGGVLAEQCSQQLSSFFQARREAKKNNS